MTRSIMRPIGSRFGTGCPSHLRNRAVVFSSGGFDGSDIDFNTLIFPSSGDLAHDNPLTVAEEAHETTHALTRCARIVMRAHGATHFAALFNGGIIYKFLPYGA